MAKKIFLVIVSSVLAFQIGCSSKKKQEDITNTSPDGSISSKDLNFNPEGSDSGQIDGLTTVTFAYDRALLTSSAKKELSRNASWIKGRPNVTLQIEGHCDRRGSVEYNLALGERRAQTVKNYLVNLGIDGGRLNIISYGKEKPIVEGDTESAHGRNRRANFVPMSQ